MGIRLRRYVPPRKGEKETRAELFVLPEEMTVFKEKWARYAQTAVEMFRAVYEKLGLESHDVTDGQPHVRRG